MRRSRSRIDGGNVGDLEAPGLAGMDRAAELLERLQKERSHKEGLKPAGLGLLHLFLTAKRRSALIVSCARALRSSNVFEMVVVEGVVDALA